MRRSNARRRKVKKRIKFSKLYNWYNSLSRERYALVTLCQLVPSSKHRSFSRFVDDARASKAILFGAARNRGEPKETSGFSSFQKNGSES